MLISKKPSSEAPNPGSIVIRFFIFILCSLFLFACGPSVKRPPRGSRPVPVRAGGPSPAAERAASGSLVEQGQQALEEGRLDAAGDLFEQAIQIDPDNGPAYYYAALVQLKLGNAEEAMGFLEKAESLLGHDPEWRERISRVFQ